MLWPGLLFRRLTLHLQTRFPSSVRSKAEEKNLTWELGCPRRTEEKYCYRVVSVGQFGLTVAPTAGTGKVVVNKSFFAVFFSSFELGGITKHLMFGPSGKSKFCFPSTLNVLLGLASGNITHCFPWGQSLSAHYYPSALRRVQITPKTSTNITRYLYSRGLVRNSPAQT